MNLEARVEIVAQSDAEADEEGGKVPVLNIVGEDLGVLIGRQNEVASALEFITRLAVNQQSHTRSDFVVDVNGYRAKRAESLRRLAFRTAEQVMQTNRTMALEPMPPAERRIIHLALRDHPKVYTQSVGEGDKRKVTIVPKRE
jgi:spoIIIJ-associated protein